MGALRQPRPSGPSESLHKPPKSETATVESPVDKLRSQTDLAADTGYSPLYHSMLADIPRLMSSLVGTWVLLHALRLSLGQKGKDGRQQWSAPLSSEEYSVLCACNVRDVQRQISELKERGLIEVRTLKTAGLVKYSICLLLEKWGKLPSYAEWKRRRVVAIDEAAAELAEDEAPVEISKEAVHLTKKPQRVTPGRSTKSVKVNVGVNSFRFQSTDSTVDLIHETVIQSGCLIVSVTSEKGETKAKGEYKGNAERHTCRAVPPNEGIQNTPTNEGSTILHPRAAELVKLFDPILAKSAARLLSGDPKSLQAACEAVQECPHDFLVKHAIDRAAREVKSPLHVQDICRDALRDWKTSMVLDGAGLRLKSEEVASAEEVAELIAKERAARLARKRGGQHG